jgi:hypothetical protein
MRSPGTLPTHVGEFVYKPAVVSDEEATASDAAADNAMADGDENQLELLPAPARRRVTSAGRDYQQRREMKRQATAAKKAAKQAAQLERKRKLKVKQVEKAEAEATARLEKEYNNQRMLMYGCCIVLAW